MKNYINLFKLFFLILLIQSYPSYGEYFNEGEHFIRILNRDSQLPDFIKDFYSSNDVEVWLSSSPYCHHSIEISNYLQIQKLIDQQINFPIVSIYGLTQDMLFKEFSLHNKSLLVISYLLEEFKKHLEFSQLNHFELEIHNLFTKNTVNIDDDDGFLTDFINLLQKYNEPEAQKFAHNFLIARRSDFQIEPWSTLIQQTKKLYSSIHLTSLPTFIIKTKKSIFLVPRNLFMIISKFYYIEHSTLETKFPDSMKYFDKSQMLEVVKYLVRNHELLEK